jgi:hypothetical protein
MKIIIWIMKNPSRIEHLNKLRYPRYFPDYCSIVFNSKISWSERLLNKIFQNSKKVILVYTDSEFPERKKNFRVWWNTPTEVPSNLDSDKNFFTLRNPIEDVVDLKFYPIISSKNKHPQIARGRIVFFGEVDNTTSLNALQIWETNRVRILNNLKLSREESFWNLLQNSSAEKFNIFRDLQNLIRLECIRSLLNSNRDKIVLVGDGWSKLKLTDRQTIFNSDYRAETYRGSICIDFGSKSGSSSIYQRSIEIIESGGLLFQAMHPDSNEILGTEISSLINFNSKEDMHFKVDNLLQNSNLVLKLIEEVSKKFSNSSYHYKSQFDQVFKS